MTHSYSDHPAVTLSIRIPPEMRDELENLADATGRTKSFLAAEAISSYLASQAWQVKAVEDAVKKADSNKTKFIDHHKVVDWLNSWGTKEEQEPPK